MKFKRMFADKTESCEKTGSTIEEAKKHLAKEIGIKDICSIDIVCISDGIIYENTRPLDGIPSPLEVMVGNPNRKISPDLVTSKPDVIVPSETDPRIEMSCGHAITPDNLFGHMKNTLMSNVQPCIRCYGCSAEWDMNEIVKKADMTEDEIYFFGYKISLNSIFNKGSETSQCPSCKSFCQRQQNKAAVRCVVCTKKMGSVFDFCWDCHLQWNPGHKCADGRLDIQEVINNASLKTMGYSNMEGVPSSRMCPECTNFIEHISGCKTMTCQRCKTTFCFACLKTAENGKLQCGSYAKVCTVAPIQKVP